MKRSEINAQLKEAKDFFRRQAFYLPPFADWSPQDWTLRDEACNGIRAAQLGWDITDFGHSDFERMGLLLFTIRNGCQRPGLNHPYCEKIMKVNVGQVTPWHFHKKKTEDIVNRGGGRLVLELDYSDAAPNAPPREIRVWCDGQQRTLKSHKRLVLSPGESVTLPPLLCHQFYGEDQTVLVGEISSVNDDASDNYFIQPLPRYPKIEEDAAPLHCLCTEYPDSHSKL
jgi:D-lyxose ketol-isomerase